MQPREYILTKPGPCLGGVVITYTTWRAIFWLQGAMTSFGLVLAFCFIPPITSQDTDSVAAAPLILKTIAAFNPMKCIRLYIYPNVLFTVRLLKSSKLAS